MSLKGPIKKKNKQLNSLFEKQLLILSEKYNVAVKKFDDSLNGWQDVPDSINDIDHFSIKWMDESLNKREKVKLFMSKWQVLNKIEKIKDIELFIMKLFDIKKYYKRNEQISGDISEDVYMMY